MKKNRNHPSYVVRWTEFVHANISRREKKNKKKIIKIDPSAQLKLFQLSEYLSQFHYHLPPVFRVPGLTLQLKPHPANPLTQIQLETEKTPGPCHMGRNCTLCLCHLKLLDQTGRKPRRLGIPVHLGRPEKTFPVYRRDAF